MILVNVRKKNSHIDFLPPFDNMISKENGNFTQKRIELVLGMCKKIFEKEFSSKNEMESASKLISVILLNHPNGKLDFCLAFILELVIKKLSNEKSKSLKILLLDNIADAMTNNVKFTLSYMENQKCLLNVFFIWFKLLGNFNRVLDMKSSIVGLTQILTLDLMQLPKSLQGSLHQIFSGLLNLIIRIVARRQEMEKQKKEIEEERKLMEQEIQRKKATGEYESEEESDDDEEDMDMILSEMKRLREDDEEQEEDELWEEDETFTSPLDNVNEIDFFIQSVKSI
jgi:hypothetical protein